MPRIDPPPNDRSPRWREEHEVEVASSADEPAPEYRMSARLVHERDDEGASVRLVVRLPFGREHVFLDARQVSTLLRLLGEALPSLQQAQAAADRPEVAATPRRAPLR